MPQCFTLTRHNASFDSDGAPSTLNKIDSDMCAYFKVPCDDRLYLRGWFDYIGFMLAMGKDWTEIQQHIEKDFGNDTRKPTMKQILSYLRERYTYNSWYEVSRQR